MMVSPVRGEFGEAAARISSPRTRWVRRSPRRIQTASVTTGNPERDTHLSSPDFLDVQNYPVMEYRSTGVKRPQDSDPIFQWAQLRSNRLGRRNHINNAPPAGPDDHPIRADRVADG